MSTKTTFKRIALVAVAALGLSVVAVAPSTAAATGTLSFGVTAASYTTDSVSTGSYFAAVSVSQIAGANNFVQITAGADTTANVIVKVAGGTINSVTQAQVATGSTAIAASGTLNTAGTELTFSSNDLEEATDASFKIPTPTAGTITATVVTRAFASGVATDTTLQTFTITVLSAAVTNVYSAANSTVYAAGPASGTAEGTTPSSTTDAAVILTAPSLGASAAVGSSAEVLKIVVDQEDANDVNLSTAVANTISITGVGAVGVNVDAPLGSYAAETAQGSDFYVFSDGRSGTGTVTVSVNGVVAKTYVVKFLGSLVSYSISYGSGATALKTLIGVGETDALTIKGLDANGNTAAALGTVNATSSNTAVATVTATDTSGVITVTGVASGTATITLANATSSATVTSTYAVTVTKLTAASVKITTDKLEYAAGEKVTITVTATDSLGAGVADGSRNLFKAATTATSGLQGTLPDTAVVLAGGKATYTVYAPLASGPVTISGTEGTATDSTTKAVVSATFVVLTDGVAEAAVDAAAEATDAANAATDAANAAAEAADAATAAAQDAADAVAALSTQVSEMVNALKKQITALTNLVIKIQKKVKA
jgi:hypothetical protein